MDLREEYMLNRRLLQQRTRRLQKHGYTPSIKIPKIPKRITKGSIRKLVKLLTKTPTVREMNKKLGLTATGKLKKSTKKKIKQKLGLEKSRKPTTKKKKSSKAKSPKPNNYLPSEKDRIIDNVTNSFYGIDDIDKLIGDMTIASKRGNIQHTSNINELKSILRKSFDNACFEDGETEVAKRLREHSDDVNKAIETIEEYYKDSDEESLREAIDEIENLIQIITDNNISIQESSELEEEYTRTTDFFNDNDEIIYKSLSDSAVMGHYQENNFIVDSETGEVLEKFVI